MTYHWLPEVYQKFFYGSTVLMIQFKKRNGLVSKVGSSNNSLGTTWNILQCNSGHHDIFACESKFIQSLLWCWFDGELKQWCCVFRYQCHQRVKMGRKWPGWCWIMRATQNGSVIHVISGMCSPLHINKVLQDIAIFINSLCAKVANKLRQVNYQQRQWARNCDSTCTLGSHPQWSCVLAACCPPLWCVWICRWHKACCSGEQVL